ncbi:hypothetical protein [Streptomyces sp. NPDC039016]|uniref:hypothetical protein n=1 Tax=Streptomyces sp. NPDC039016 TaxID=3154330 RepID=UPI0033CBC9BD
MSGATFAGPKGVVTAGGGGALSKGAVGSSRGGDCAGCDGSDGEMGLPGQAGERGHDGAVVFSYTKP